MTESRRTFLFSLAGIALVAATASSTSRPSSTSRARHAASLASLQRPQDPFVINLLGGLPNPNAEQGPPAGALTGGRRPPDARAISDALASGLDATNATIGYVAGPADPFETSVADVAHWNRISRAHPNSLLKVWTADDIEGAAREGKVGIIFGFQNAAIMGDDAGRVGVFAGLGVKIIQLTYNTANQLGHGSMVPENGGLTDFGREVVAQLNATGTLVDLSHSGERTCLDAIAASTAPVAITHTGCRALTDLPRNALRVMREVWGVLPGRRDRDVGTRDRPRSPRLQEGRDTGTGVTIGARRPLVRIKVFRRLPGERGRAKGGRGLGGDFRGTRSAPGGDSP